MKLDRDYQLQLLEMLSSAYPNQFDHRSFCNSMDADTKQKYIANMRYLEEHGLVESGIFRSQINHPRITAKGMDFIAQDGGLTAILGLVTIRLDDATLRAIFETALQKGQSADDDKRGMIARLQSLPSDAIKHLTMLILGKGLEQLPDAVSIIESYIRQHG